MSPKISVEATATIVFGVLATLFAVVTLTLPCWLSVFRYTTSAQQQQSSYHLHRPCLRLGSRWAIAINHQEPSLDIEANHRSSTANLTNSGDNINLFNQSAVQGSPVESADGNDETSSRSSAATDRVS